MDTRKTSEWTSKWKGSLKDTSLEDVRADLPVARLTQRALQVPGHFHPPLQVQAAAQLLALETRGVHLVSAEGLGEMCGVLSGQAAGGGQAGGALGMTHHLTF